MSAAAHTGGGDQRAPGGLEQRLNRLRAGVLGANDGRVSPPAVVVGVAGATTATGPVATAGVAAARGGAVSMALGEYVSVSSQRDSEEHLIADQERALATDPEGQFNALTRLYQERGLSPETSRTVATACSAHDPLASRLRARHNIDAPHIPTPLPAALA